MERGYLFSAMTGMFLDEYGTTEIEVKGNFMVFAKTSYNEGLN